MTEGIATPAEKTPERPWRTLINSRRFGWFTLGCALFSGAVWYLSDGRAGPWPLLIAGLPWVARLISGQFPLPRTRFDPLMLGFLVSALVGLWASYDQSLAAGKFWLIVGGIVLFYAVAGQRAANLWPLLTCVAFFGGMVSLYFMLTHDWTSIPAKIEVVNQMGLELMSIRPAAFNRLHSLHPNVAGGIIAMLIPFSVVAGIRSFRRGRYFIGSMVVVGLAIMAAGLLFTTSRGAWVALVGGLVMWLLWIGAERNADSLFLTQRKTLGLGILLLVGSGLSVVFVAEGGLIGLFNRLPGPTSAESRLGISRDALDLVEDFWVTGGGLGSFDGLYSQYIQVIPFHAVIHSHNLFLNVTIEQGLTGILLLVSMLALSYWWLSDPRRSRRRRSIHGFSLAAGATYATLAILCLHGLVDDSLYGSRGVLLLWLPVAITAMLFPRRVGWLDSLRSIELPVLVGFGVIAVAVATILLLYRIPIISAWQANLGAVEMARVELRDYPSGEWSDGSEVVALSSAKARFDRALMFDQDNRTAWHRLGLIAMLKRDYETAEDSLYKAYLIDPGHRGLRKTLAYSYIWSGNIDRAIPLLMQIPEAPSELANYQGWWSQQGEQELSQRAEDARLLLIERTSQQ